jgi:hypothetical protein
MKYKAVGAGVSEEKEGLESSPEGIGAEALGYAGKLEETQKKFALAAGLDLSATENPNSPAWGHDNTNPFRILT